MCNCLITYITFANHSGSKLYRPIGIVAGSINKPGQTAAEIVDEMVKEAAQLLGAASTYLTPNSKL